MEFFKNLILTLETLFIVICVVYWTCRSLGVDNRATLKVAQCLNDKRFEEWAQENYMYVEKATMWDSGEVQIILHNTLNKKGD